VDKITLFKTT